MSSKEPKGFKPEYNDLEALGENEVVQVFDESSSSVVNTYKLPLGTTYDSFFENSPASDLTIEDVFKEGGILSENIDTYVPRDSQISMAEGIEEAIAKGTLFVAEAGTGTGKTFAYLIPALLSGRVVVISTASKALQDQIVRQDLPRLWKLLNLEGNYMALKGFSNYVCKRKYFQYMSGYMAQNQLNLPEVDVSSLSDEELKAIPDGDFVNFEQQVTDPVSGGKYKEVIRLSIKELSKLTNLINSDTQKLRTGEKGCTFGEVDSTFSRSIVKAFTCSSHTCLKRKCKFREECFPYLARIKALSCKVVVINHQLFFAHRQVEDVFQTPYPGFILPQYGTLIFDEAHELPNVGRSARSSTVSTAQCKWLKDSVNVFINDEQKQADLPESSLREMLASLTSAFDGMLHYLLGTGLKSDDERFSVREGQKRNFLEFRYLDYAEKTHAKRKDFEQDNKEFIKQARVLYKAIKSCHKLLFEFRERNEEFIDELLDNCLAMCDTLNSLMHIGEENSEYYGNAVGWIEYNSKSFVMALSPLEISKEFGFFLKQARENKLGIVMTSATLKVGGHFDKFLRDLGAESDTKTFDVPSHFDYASHAAMYWSENFPPANDVRREVPLIAMLKPLIDSSIGGVFFLTTSFRALNHAADELTNIYKDQRLVLRQSGGMSNSALIKAFKKDGHAILVGTSSFWAGVDIQGEALSLVIIDKLPFTSPDDPLLKARCESFEEKELKKAHAEGKKKSGNSAFSAICVPEAVIELRQGVGRLIRHEQDTGALVICDPRLEIMPYGKTFQKSLPPMKKCSSLAEICDFISRLTKDSKQQ